MLPWTWRNCLGCGNIDVGLLQKIVGFHTSLHIQFSLALSLSLFLHRHLCTHTHAQHTHIYNIIYIYILYILYILYIYYIYYYLLILKHNYLILLGYLSHQSILANPLQRPRLRIQAAGGWIGCLIWRTCLPVVDLSWKTQKKKLWQGKLLEFMMIQRFIYPLWIQTLSEKVLNPLNHTPNTS